MNFTWTDHHKYKIAKADGYMIMLGPLLGPFGSSWLATLYDKSYQMTDSITFYESDVEKAKKKAVRILSTCVEKSDVD